MPEGRSYRATWLGRTKLGEQRAFRWADPEAPGAGDLAALWATGDPFWEAVLSQDEVPIQDWMTAPAIACAAGGTLDVSDGLALRDGGRWTVFLIDDPEWPELPELTMEGVSTVLDRLTSGWPVEQRPAVAHALESLGCDVTRRHADHVDADCPGAGPLAALFDTRSRYVGLQ